MSRRILLALVRKDLRVTFSDRRAVIISFIVPIALGSFMALIMGGAGGSGGSGKFAVRVTDLDQSKLSREIVAHLQDEKNLDLKLVDEAQARSDVRKGDAVAAVVFPPEFGKTATRALFGPRAKPTVLLLHDPSHSAEMAMLRGILMQHIMQTVSEEAFSGTSGMESLQDAMEQVQNANDMGAEDKRMLQDMFASIIKWQQREDAMKSTAPEADRPLGGGLKAPFETRDEVIMAGPQVERTAMQGHAFAGMAVQFILFGAIEAAVGLLTERQRGLWSRIRSAPVARTELLVGKTLSSAIMGVLTTIVVFGFGALVFHLRVRGSLLGFVLVAVSYALASAAFGLLIAALGKSPQAARGFSILVVLLMVMLGGAWMPTFIFPTWLQQVTPIIPTRWAVDGFDGTLWRGLTFIETLPAVGALLGFAAVFWTLAALRFRWNSD